MEVSNSVLVAVVILVLLLALVKLRTTNDSTSYRYLLILLVGGAILFFLYHQFSKKVVAPPPSEASPAASKETTPEEKYVNYDRLQGHLSGLQAMTNRKSSAPMPIPSVQSAPIPSSATSAAEFAPATPVGKVINDDDDKVMNGNFLEVTAKDVDVHSAVSNNALIPVMEQYMKIHENDPTRTVTLQSSLGLPFYDTRDPVNVKITEFPSTISAKLPIA